MARPDPGRGVRRSGLDPAWVFLAGASLERWTDLGADARAAAPEALRRAFADPGFVARALPTAIAALGRQETLRLVPDEMGALRTASGLLMASGDVASAAAIVPRVGVAARREREARLRRIRELLHYGDVDGARSACHAWVVDFAPGDFDDEVGRRQSADLLELWPAGVAGTWRTDPRANLVRYFLGGRTQDVEAGAMLTATDSISEVPPVVRARVLLLAGREADALAVAAQPSSSGAFEWSAFYEDLARTRLARGDGSGARDALGRIAPSAREGCDALILRRDVASNLGDARETALLEEALSSVERHTYGADSWSSEGSASVCLDSGSGDPKSWVVRLGVQTAGPALLRCDWDGGALPPILVGGETGCSGSPSRPGPAAGHSRFRRMPEGRSAWALSVSSRFGLRRALLRLGRAGGTGREACPRGQGTGGPEGVAVLL